MHMICKIKLTYVVIPRLSRKWRSSSIKIILKTCLAKMTSGENFLDGLEMFPLSTVLEYEEYGYGVAGFVETLFEGADDGNLSTRIELQHLELEDSTFDGIYNVAQVILC
jgi:hypothetical protein